MELTQQFNAKNPDFLKDVQDNREALEAVRKIEERRVMLAQKLELHCQKHRDLWIAGEAERQYAKESHQLQYNLPQPKNFGPQVTQWNDHVRQATFLIDARIESRMQSLDTISRRMQNDAVLEMINQQKHQQLARQHLDQDVREIHQTVHRERIDTYRDFEANKVQRVEDARRNGSSMPERDVYEAYKQQDNNILAHKEHLLTQAYEKHGFNYEMEKHALTQRYNQKM